MNNSNLSKKNLISYITKNYIKFKLFLKKLEESKLMTSTVFKYADDLTPEEFDKVINEMPKKKFASLGKQILESNKKLIAKSSKGGAKVRRDNSSFDCSVNNYDEEKDCYLGPISLDCLDDVSGVLITPDDNMCYDKVELCDWFSRGNNTNPTTRGALSDNWIRANCVTQAARQPLRDFGEQLLQGVVLYGTAVRILGAMGGWPPIEAFSLNDFAVYTAMVFWISAARTGELPYHGGKINSIKAKKKYSVKRKTRRKRGKRGKTRKRKRRKSKRRR